MKVKLSIIIPCYNSAEFISRTMDMLKKQDLSDCELIFINDGSTDNTLNILNFRKMEFENIKIISKQNEGVSVARNLGLRNAIGEYIYFFDSDDYLAEDTIKFYKSVLNIDDVNLYCFGYKMDNNGKNHDYSVKKYDAQTFKNFSFQKLYFSKEINLHICSCIFKRQFLETNDLLFTVGRKIGEDTEFIIKAIFHADAIRYYSRICYIYLIRENSVMAGFQKYTHSDSLTSKINLLKEFPNKKLTRFYNYWLAYNYLHQYKLFLKGHDYKTEYIAFFKKYKYLLMKRMFFNPFFFLLTKFVFILPINVVCILMKIL